MWLTTSGVWLTYSVIFAFFWLVQAFLLTLLAFYNINSYWNVFIIEWVHSNILTINIFICTWKISKCSRVQQPTQSIVWVSNLFLVFGLVPMAGSYDCACSKRSPECHFSPWLWATESGKHWVVSLSWYWKYSNGTSDEWLHYHSLVKVGISKYYNILYWCVPISGANPTECWLLSHRTK